MIDILILLIINSLLCFGFWNACLYEIKKGNIQIGNEDDYSSEKIENKGVLWFVEKWAQGKWFHKPLSGCLPCMGSFHSAYVYWGYMYAINNLDLNAILFYPVYVLALSGLNYLIDRE